MCASEDEANWVSFQCSTERERERERERGGGRGRRRMFIPGSTAAVESYILYSLLQARL